MPRDTFGLRVPDDDTDIFVDDEELDAGSDGVVAPPPVEEGVPIEEEEGAANEF